MSLIAILWRRVPFLFIISISFGISGALSRLGLLAVMSGSLAHLDTPSVSLLQFCLLAAISLISQYGGTWSTSTISTKLSVMLRKDITRLVLSAPLSALEMVGLTRVTSSLGEDIGKILSGLPWGIIIVRSLIFVIACFAYLAVVSWSLFLLTVSVLLPGLAIMLALQRAFLKALEQIRSSREKSWQLHRILLDGIKQLKLDGWKRRQFEIEYDGAENISERISRTANLYYNASVSIFTTLYFILLGLFIYGGLYHSANRDIIIPFLVLTVVIIPPLLEMTTGSRALGEAKIGIDKIEKLKRELAASAETQLEHQGGNDIKARDSAIQKLELLEVFKTYRSQESKFSLGPVSFSVEAGESLFIVGGNGSGKTTLVKVLAGLYSPDVGEVRIDGAKVDGEGLAWYRKHISAVFSDVCLFEGLPPNPREGADEHAHSLVQRLRLSHLIDESGQLFERTNSFSSGERKRVALLFAYLEHRPIFIFDEFAADQDPEAKELFYYTIIPELRRQGKIVIVVTHDNRFFDSADKILRLERDLPPQIIKTTLNQSENSGTSVVAESTE